MRKWISDLLFRIGAAIGPRPINPLENLPCLKVLVKEDLRLRVLHNRKRCGHIGCIIQLSLLDRADDSWMEIAFVFGENIRTAAWLLGQAVEFIDSIHECAPEAALVDG